MGFFRCHTIILSQTRPISINVDCVDSRKIPQISIIGLPKSLSADLREKISAIFNANGIKIPSKKYTISISPEILVEPNRFSVLAIILAILGSAKLIPPSSLDEISVFGSLDLSGRLVNIPSLAEIQWVQSHGRGVILPYSRPGLSPFSVRKPIRGGQFETLAQVIEFLREGKIPRLPPNIEVFDPANAFEPEFFAPERVIRAIEISVSGGHPLLWMGASSSLDLEILSNAAACFPIPNPEEEWELNRISKSSGNFRADYSRPFRSVTMMESSGNAAKKMIFDELMLASGGVLLMDPIYAPARRIRVQNFDDFLRRCRDQSLPTLLMGRIDFCHCERAEEKGQICLCSVSRLKEYATYLKRSGVWKQFPLRCNLPHRHRENYIRLSTKEIRNQALKVRMERIRLGSESDFKWSDTAKLILQDRSRNRSKGEEAQIAAVAITISLLDDSIEVQESHILEAIFHNDSMNSIQKYQSGDAPQAAF